MEGRLIVLALTILAQHAEARSRPAVDTTCLSRALPTPGWTQVNLPDSIGSLALPAGTVPQPLGKNPHGQHFVLEDSTVVEIWVTPEPVASFMTDGAQLKVTHRCQALVSGLAATVTRLELGAPGHASEFVGLLSVVVDTNHAVNITVSTATMASRDEMLAIVARMQLRSGGR
jgi:hypothetical protein